MKRKHEDPDPTPREWALKDPHASGWDRWMSESVDYTDEFIDELDERRAHEAVREVHFMLGQHPAIQRYRVVTTAPAVLPTADLLGDCELCNERDHRVTQYGFEVCLRCAEFLVRNEDILAGVTD